MAFRSPLFLIILLLIHSPVRGDDDSDLPSDGELAALTRDSFPSDFLFGASSSAYQYEGAANLSFRQPNIWDSFVKGFPDKIANHSNATTADEFYELHKEDVYKIKDIGLDAFRVSISWSRLINYEGGKAVVNDTGYKYYNNLINELVNASANGKDVKPFVTLFHWDTPQYLEDKYKGFLSESIVNDFVEYANISFKLFGDRVKHWVTFNEPHNFAGMGYASGQFAPGRCTPMYQYQYAFAVGRFAASPDQYCPEGDSGTEPYKVAHNILRSHAAAVKLYRDNYKDSQNGTIGIVLNVDWIIPYNETNPDDIDAVDRAFAFNYGWFMQPIYNGSYPHVMRKYVGHRLPVIHHNESMLLKGSYDFIGLNYYTAGYAMAVNCSKGPKNYYTDPCVNMTKSRNGTDIGSKGQEITRDIGPKTCSSWLYVYPRGIREILLYTKNKYDNPKIYITENGFPTCNHHDLDDKRRIKYHFDHLKWIQRVLPNKTGVEDGTEKNKNVKGYLLWSLLDDFEWSSGYSVEYGIIHVNYTHNLKRTYKQSAKWYKHFLNPGKPIESNA